MTRQTRFNAGLLLLLITLCLMSLSTGALLFDLGQILSALIGQGEAEAIGIIRDIRLPRIVAAVLAGLALGAAGAAMQGLLRNPLAEPGTMGVSATSALFATATVYFGLAEASRWIMPVSAIAGALLATALIAASAVRLRGIGSMILIGVALSALAGAIMALFVNLAPNPFSLSDLINWTAGSVANRDWLNVSIAAPAVAIGISMLLLSRRALTAMLFGEELAASVGVDLARTRVLLVVGTGLATGGAVAVAGMIGFVGLIAPHLVRAAVGHDAGRLVVPSALLAATMLVAADWTIRMLPWGADLHLGTLTALIGAPVFAWVAWKAGNLRHG
jgi:iron complex transport system permease protein